MGYLRVGEEVFDETGRPTPIVAATGVMFDRACAEVVFSDGQTIVADLAHRWLTRSKSERKHAHLARVRTTKEIADSLLAETSGTMSFGWPGRCVIPNNRSPSIPTSWEYGSEMGLPARPKSRLAGAMNRYSKKWPGPAMPCGPPAASAPSGSVAYLIGILVASAMS